MTAVLTYNSRTKAIGLNDLPEEAWTYLVGRGTDDGESTVERYKRVPWLYRGVKLRAQAVEAMPYCVKKGEAEIEELARYPWLKDLGRLFHLIEMDLCLGDRGKGVAYVLIEQNRAGVLRLRRLLPSSIRPIYDRNDGHLIEYERKIGQRTYTFQPDEIIAFEEANPEGELGAGPAPAATALAAAGLLHNADIYSAGYFKRGAIPAVVLAVEGNPPDAEMQKLASWWKRMLSGVKNAFQAVAIRANVKPQVIGSPMKDLAMPELTATKREDIATALGIPPAILFSEAANYATAEVDDRNFYSKTIIPQCQYIAWRLNQSKPMQALGLKVEFEWQKLEVFQKYESEKAVALMPLVAGGVMTKNELREQMGLEPLDGLDEPVDPQALERERMDREDRRAEAERKLEARRPSPRPKALTAGAWAVAEDEVEDILSERLRLVGAEDVA